MYRFDLTSSFLDGRLGAPHFMEVPFVFDDLDLDSPLKLHDTSEESWELAAKMSTAWAAFARTGNPGHAGLPDWPAYDENRRATMLFDSTCRVVDDPDAAERVAWEELRGATL